MTKLSLIFAVFSLISTCTANDLSWNSYQDNEGKSITRENVEKMVGENIYKQLRLAGFVCARAKKLGDTQDQVECSQLQNMVKAMIKASPKAQNSIQSWTGYSQLKLAEMYVNSCNSTHPVWSQSALEAIRILQEVAKC